MRTQSSGIQCTQKCPFTYFLGQTPHFLGKMQENRSNKIHNWKAVFVAFFLEPNGGGPIIVSTLWQSNIHFLQGLLNNTSTAIFIFLPWALVITAHCPYSIVHCALHNLHYTLHDKHCTPHTSHLQRHTENCTLHTAHCILQT